MQTCRGLVPPRQRRIQKLFNARRTIKSKHPDMPFTSDLCGRSSGHAYIQRTL